MYKGLEDEDFRVRFFAYNQLIILGEKSNELERGIPLISGDLIYAVCQSGVEWGSDFYCIYYCTIPKSLGFYHTKKHPNGNMFECLSDAPEDKPSKIQTGMYAVTSPAYLFAYCVDEITAQTKKEEAYVRAFSELPCTTHGIYRDSVIPNSYSGGFNLKDWVEVNEVIIEDHLKVEVPDGWNKFNHLDISRYTSAIKRSLYDQKRFALLRDIWEHIGYKPMAYIQEYRVDRPCYLQIHSK